MRNNGIGKLSAAAEKAEPETRILGVPHFSQGRVMNKTVLILATILAIFLQRERIADWLDPPPPTQTHNEVVLYATSWCGYCAKTRSLFAEQGIVYREEDIEKSADSRRRYENLGGRGVPVIDVRGTVIHGYDPATILAAVRQR
jgi:mycoredoxin